MRRQQQHDQSTEGTRGYLRVVVRVMRACE
jgi:hypothetical protein